jgi:hypothetical protein
VRPRHRLTQKAQDAAVPHKEREQHHVNHCRAFRPLDKALENGTVDAIYTQINHAGSSNLSDRLWIGSVRARCGEDPHHQRNAGAQHQHGHCKGGSRSSGDRSDDAAGSEHAGADER